MTIYRLLGSNRIQGVSLSRSHFEFCLSYFIMQMNGFIFFLVVQVSVLFHMGYTKHHYRDKIKFVKYQKHSKITTKNYYDVTTEWTITQIL